MTSNPGPAWKHWALAIGLAATTTLLAHYFSTSKLIGPDEGLYLSAAKSLRYSGAYRLANLPSEPAETKYPPLYPFLLALLGTVIPIDPDHVRALKLVNVFSLGAVGVLAFKLCERAGAPLSNRLLASALVMFAPALFSFTDLFSTELVFTLFVVATVCAVAQGHEANATTIAALACCAALTRMAGLPMVAAATWHVLSRRDWRQTGRAILVVLVMLAPWLVWRYVARVPVSPLEEFYVTYERSLWQQLAASPTATLLLVWENLVQYIGMTPLVFGWPVPLLTGSMFILAAVGWSSWPASARSFLSKASLLYGLAILGHPYTLDRYLIPFVPIVILTAVLGTRRLLSAVRHASASWARPLLIVVVVTPLVLVSITDLLWLIRYERVTRTLIHAGFGRPMTFGWSGFEETIDWIRQTTPPTARLASFYDPVYAFYTGRQGTRAWLHIPEARDGISGRLRSPDEMAVVVQKEFDRLRIDYLLESPYLVDPEGQFGRATVKAVLNRHESPWSLVFTTADGRHTIYERSRR